MPLIPSIKFTAFRIPIQRMRTGINAINPKLSIRNNWWKTNKKAVTWKSSLTSGRWGIKSSTKLITATNNTARLIKGSANPFHTDYWNQAKGKIIPPPRMVMSLCDDLSLGVSTIFHRTAKWKKRLISKKFIARRMSILPTSIILDHLAIWYKSWLWPNKLDWPLRIQNLYCPLIASPP